MGGPVNWGVSAAVHAALETALETAVPAAAEEETYPRSAAEEAPLQLAGSRDVFLPRRRPTTPSPAGPRDDSRRDDSRRDDGRPDDSRRDDSRRDGTAGPAPAPHQPPDMALLDQVLRGLQRMA
jgi:hypothetical protein